MAGRHVPQDGGGPRVVGIDRADLLGGDAGGLEVPGGQRGLGGRQQPFEQAGEPRLGRGRGGGHGVRPRWPARRRAGPGRAAGRPGWPAVPRTGRAGPTRWSSARAAGGPVRRCSTVTATSAAGIVAAPASMDTRSELTGPVGSGEPGHRDDGALRVSSAHAADRRGRRRRAGLARQRPAACKPASRPCSATSSTVSVHVVQARAQSLASWDPDALPSASRSGVEYSPTLTGTSTSLARGRGRAGRPRRENSTQSSTMLPR